MRHIYFLLLYLLFSIQLFYAQDFIKILDSDKIKFEEITSKDGLKHNTITSIFQDSRGYMWFGTYNGIYKYDGYTFRIYNNTVKNTLNLTSNLITAINEDSWGNLWIGANGGLYRYNRQLDNFVKEIKIDQENDRSISISNKVNCIYQDSNDVLWIATSMGLYQLIKNPTDDLLFDYRRFTNGGKNSIPSNSVRSVVQDLFGNLWIGTTHGLSIIPVDYTNDPIFIDYKNYSKEVPFLTDQPIEVMSVDQKGYIWVGTPTGLKRFVWNASGSQFTVVNYNHKRNDVNSLVNDYVTAICPDRNGTVWVGTKFGGISRYSHETDVFTNYSRDYSDDFSINSNHINDIYESKNGLLWICSEGGFINKVDFNKKRFLHFKPSSGRSSTLSDKMINFIYGDSSNNIWIGTFSGGLNKLIYHKGKPLFAHSDHLKDFENKNGARYNNISAFCEDDFGNFWMGTPHSGLLHLKLLASESSLNSIEFRSSVLELPTDNITTIYKDHVGDIWIGSFENGGLLKFTPNRFGAESPIVRHFKYSENDPNSLSSNNIATIFEDSDNVLWIGTYGGGIVKIIRDENNNPHRYIRIQNDPDTTSSLSNNSVFSFCEDKNGNIWIATFGGGLNMITTNERHKENPIITSYRKKDGLSNEELYGILEDELGNLWISSNNGIFKFNIESEVFTNFQISDGLQDVNFRRQAFWKDKNGVMYFGGINGFNVFKPERFVDNDEVPLVEIVDFKVFNESVSVGERVLDRVILTKSISETNHLVLNYDHSSFSFEFSALHYSSPDQNKYAYMLEGLDEKWNFTDAKRRYASYVNLASGNYVFKVRASNNDNLWTDNARIIEISILPPWWRTWWAYSLYVLSFIYAIWLFRRYIVLNEEYQNKLKIERIEQEKIKEINKAKLEFFTNISHEFKTPLTLILGPLHNMIRDVSQGLDVKKSSLLLMERNAQHLFRLINQIMEFRKIEAKKLKLDLSNGDLVSFCKELVFSFKNLAETREINLAFECNEYIINSVFDFEKFEKIVNNLISNAIKNTPVNGSVKVSLSLLRPKERNGVKMLKNRTVKLEVSDTGKGIAKSELSSIFRRFYKIEDNERHSSTKSGIGLALTKSLVKFLKGSISVDSIEGIGSNFIVELPIDIVEYPIHQTGNNEVSGRYMEQLLPNHLLTGQMVESVNSLPIRPDLPTILIVEDNIDLQIFIKNSLISDYNIFQAYDGIDGFEIAKREVPDIIISDIMMPKMDGIELCNIIKNNYITNHIPFIILTVKASIDHRMEGLEVGADAYIPKPFLIEHLEARLKNLLKQRKLLKQKFSKANINFDSKLEGIMKSDKDFLEKAEKIIDSNLTNSQFGVSEFSNEMSLSKMQLYRKLKSIRGCNTNEFIREYRLKKAAQLFNETSFNITEVLYQVGYTNRSYFTKCYKEMFGMTPREHMKKIKLDQ